MGSGVGFSCSTNSHHYTTLVYIHVHNSCFMTMKSENQLNMENFTAMFGLNPAVEDIHVTTSHIQQVFRSDIPTLYSTVMWPSSSHVGEHSPETTFRSIYNTIAMISAVFPKVIQDFSNYHLLFGLCILNTVLSKGVITNETSGS